MSQPGISTYNGSGNCIEEILKIVAVSDTHCHSLLEIIGNLEADVLILAGDSMNLGPEEEFYPFVGGDLQ